MAACYHARIMGFMAGWQRRVVHGGITLVAPAPMVGAVRIRTGLPLVPARQVVEELVRPGFARAAFEPRSPPRALTTQEGEHAAIFELVARPPELEVRRTIAVVLGDHDLVTIDGQVVRPDDFDVTAPIEALAKSFSLGLGSDRARRYLYLPPDGWHRRARFRAEVWLAPDYPRDPGMITVFHARPLEPRAPIAQHARLFEEVSAECGLNGPLEREVVQVPSGLTGERVIFAATIDGTKRLATNVALGDTSYVHLLRLETDVEHAAANGQAFGRLVLSVEPIPRLATPGEAFDQWSE